MATQVPLEEPAAVVEPSPPRQDVAGDDNASSEASLTEEEHRLREAAASTVQRIYRNRGRPQTGFKWPSFAELKAYFLVRPQRWMMTMSRPRAAPPTHTFRPDPRASTG